MGACCQKREQSDKMAVVQNGKYSVPAGGITSNEVPNLLEFTTRFFTQCIKCWFL